MIKEKIKNIITKLERGFVELAEFPFKGILNSFILAIVVIIAILIIAAAGRSFGAGMPPANNILIPATTASKGKNYQALALKIYKKVYRLDKKIGKTEGHIRHTLELLNLPDDLQDKIRNGYEASKAREISKVHKKNKK